MFSHLILDSDLDGNLCAITLDAAEDSAKGTNAEAILFMEVIRRLSRDPKQKRKQSFSRPRIGTRLDDLEFRILRKTAQNNAKHIWQWLWLQLSTRDLLQFDKRILQTKIFQRSCHSSIATGCNSDECTKVNFQTLFWLFLIVSSLQIQSI